MSVWRCARPDCPQHADQTTDGDPWDVAISHDDSAHRPPPTRAARPATQPRNRPRPAPRPAPAPAPAASSWDTREDDTWLDRM